MRRQCKCGKKLQTSCEYCHSLNIRESRTRPGTFNCGNCFRRHMELKLSTDGLCYECEQRQRQEAQSAR